MDKTTIKRECQDCIAILEICEDALMKLRRANVPRDDALGEFVNSQYEAVQQKIRERKEKEQLEAEKMKAEQQKVLRAKGSAKESSGSPKDN